MVTINEFSVCLLCHQLWIVAPICGRRWIFRGTGDKWFALHNQMCAETEPTCESAKNMIILSPAAVSTSWIDRSMLKHQKGLSSSSIICSWSKCRSIRSQCFQVVPSLFNPLTRQYHRWYIHTRELQHLEFGIESWEVAFVLLPVGHFLVLIASSSQQLGALVWLNNNCNKTKGSDILYRGLSEQSLLIIEIIIKNTQSWKLRFEY